MLVWNNAVDQHCDTAIPKVKPVTSKVTAEKYQIETLFLLCKMFQYLNLMHDR